MAELNLNSELLSGSRLPLLYYIIFGQGRSKGFNEWGRRDEIKNERLIWEPNCYQNSKFRHLRSKLFTWMAELGYKPTSCAPESSTLSRTPHRLTYSCVNMGSSCFFFLLLNPVMRGEFYRTLPLGLGKASRNSYLEADTTNCVYPQDSQSGVMGKGPILQEKAKPEPWPSSPSWSP